MLLFDENCTSQLKGLCFADPRTSKQQSLNSFALILILPKGLQEDQNIIMSASLAPECNKVKEHVFYQITLWPRQKAEPTRRRYDACFLKWYSESRTPNSFSLEKLPTYSTKNSSAVIQQQTNASLCSKNIRAASM